MRVSRKIQQDHHSALVTQAARLFRGRGIDAVGVADISRAAGLTHGAFYGHFPSKTALAAEACRASLLDGAAHWRARADRARAAGTNPVAAIIDAYLTERHRDHPESGCALSALGAEIARAPPPLRQALDDGIAALLEVLDTELADTNAALAVLTALSGGLTLARACAGDPERSRAVLRAAAAMARQAAKLPPISGADMLAKILAPALARRGIHYGWVMVALTFLTTLSTSAAMGMPGVLLVPMHVEFGWEIGAISGPLAMRLALFGLIAPFAAALIMRHGVRNIIAFSTLLILTGVVITYNMTALWQLWVSWGTLLGLATGMTALVMSATVASRWFTARRGLVVGMLTAANATGQLIFLPLAANLAAAYGWRSALLPAAIAVSVCVVLAILFACDHPGQVGLAPYGETRVVAPPPRTGAGTVRTSLDALADGVRTRLFWVLAGTFFICGASTGGIIQTHFIALCHDFGMVDTESAKVLAMMGAFDFVGTILSGWLSDRYDNRWLLFWYYGLRGVSLVILPYSSFSFVGLSIFAVFYGLDWIATVPPTVKLAAAGFGRERAALMFGWIFAAHQLGGAFAAAAAGITHDVTATYLPAFFAAGLLCFLAAIAIVAVRRQTPAPAAAE